MNDSVVQLGIIQAKSEKEPSVNLEKNIHHIKELASKGAQIISVSELFLADYFCQENNPEFFNLAETVPGPTTQEFSRLAKELGVVLIGSVFEKDQDRFFNTAFVIDATGEYLGKYRKVHIPDDPKNFYSEKYYFQDGDIGFPVFQTQYAKIGLQICWDQWFPEGARSLALQGAEIIFYPTAIGWQVKGPEELGKAELEAWVTVQRGHAISNTIFVASINRTGEEKNLNFWGNSFVADPLGRILKQASSDQETNLIVACDLKTIEKVREDWPFLSCRKTESYSL